MSTRTRLLASDFLNEDQRDHVRLLGAMPPEALCWCGWYRLGECPHCPAGRTAADKIAVWCPECRSAPSPDGTRVTIHTIGCSRG